MFTILCGQCAKAPFGLQPTGLFRCDNCGHEIATSDIDIDGSEVWCVDPSGTLGKVIDPAVSVAEMEEAIDDYMAEDHDSYGELEALRRHRDATYDLLAALQVGLPLPANA